MQRAPLRRLLLSVQALLPSARGAGVRALTAQPDLDLGVNLKSAAKTAEVLRPVMTLGEELLSQAAQTPAAPAEWRDLQQQQQQTSGAKKTFYKRKLPCPPATEFSSEEGRQLFAEALTAGTMTGFFKLVEQYTTQDEPAFCGLASIAMVLNALSIDPRRPWKGSWRWFHEELLDCCLPLGSVAKDGVNLSQAACLAKCNGASVSLHRSGSFSLSDFRAAVIDAATSGTEHVIVSYTRRAFDQTGDGHFSPVGGYHAGRDLVLILDTARFKYPPHWVPLPLLFEAMAPPDPTTGVPRGYLCLAADELQGSVLFTLDVQPGGRWRGADAFICDVAPRMVKAAAANGQGSMPGELIGELVTAAPLDGIAEFVAVRIAAHQCAKDRCVPHTVRHQVLQELRATPLYQMIEPLLAERLSQEAASSATAQQQQQTPALQPAAPPPDPHLADKLAMLLLLQEPSAWGLPSDWALPEQHASWTALLDASAVSIVEGEVQYMRRQLQHIDQVMRKDTAGASDASCMDTAGDSDGSCAHEFPLDCSVRGCAGAGGSGGEDGINSSEPLYAGECAGSAAAGEATAQQQEHVPPPDPAEQKERGYHHACCGHH